MENQGSTGENQGDKKPTSLTAWVPALWSIEAIVIAGGVVLGALVFGMMAKPAFDDKQAAVGYLFVVMAVLCPLIPGLAAAHIHGVYRKLGLSGKRKHGNKNAVP